MGKTNKKSKVNIIMLQKRNEVVDMIEKGASLTELNDALFHYDDYNTFTFMFRKEEFKLLMRYKEVKAINKTIRNIKKTARVLV